MNRAIEKTLLLVSLVAAAAFPQPLAAQRASHDPNAFACSSVHYMLDDFEKQPTAPSPDRKRAIQLTKEYRFRVVLGTTVISTLTFPDITSNIEIGWSPDSSQFFVSYSDGGAIGRYHVHLYRITGTNVKESAVPNAVASHFKAKHWCKQRGNNLFFLDWTQDARTGFFVTEVYPTGDCKEGGVYRGYAVDLEDGKILRILTDEETNSVEKSCRASGKLVLPLR